MKQFGQNATYLDVRTPEEFASGHIKNAVNIPLDQVAARVAEIRNLQAPIVAYCRSGQRSATAVAFLKQQGIRDIVNGGGIDNLKLMA